MLPVIGLVCALFLTAAPALAQDRPLEVVRHAGPSRTHTAAEVSRATHGDGSDAVVLARADAYADALAAAPLAAALDAPVLLTGPEALDDAAVEEIQRLGATTALLVGELSATVAGEALDAGITTVRRIRADDGWATLAAVAVEVASEQIRELAGHGVDRVHLYTLNRPDLALAVCERLALVPT